MMPDRSGAVGSSISHRVALSLRSDILSGSIPIGGRIAGEHELMQRFSVSRQTVREALRELATEGLVRSRRGPGGGAFVAKPDLGRMEGLIGGAGRMIAAAETFHYQEVCRAIYEIESALYRMAFERRDADAMAEMRAVAERIFDPSHDSEDFFEDHMSFNRALWKAGGNGPLVFIMQAFMQYMREATDRQQVAIDVEGHTRFLRGSYRELLEALETGDEARGSRAIRANLEYWLSNTPLKP